MSRTAFPRFTQVFFDRHGGLRVYYRRSAKSVPLPDPYDGKLAGHYRGSTIADLPKPTSDAFWDAYWAVHAGHEPKARPAIAERPQAGTVAAAVALYVKSKEFREGLKASSQSKYRRVLTVLCTQRGRGDRRIADLQTKEIKGWLAEMKLGNALDLLKALRALFAFLVDHEHVDTDPTARIDRKKLPGWDKKTEYHCWTDDEIAQYRAHHPIGSTARLALELLLHTAQRGRSDVTRMGWGDVHGNKLDVTQQKTGWEGKLAISPELAKVIAATAETGLKTFLVTPPSRNHKGGKPFTPPTFSFWFRRWRDEAGLPQHCRPHGLRKAFVRLGFEHGAEVYEIAAQTGHQNWDMVRHYGKSADQPRLAEAAVTKIGTPIIKPSNPVLQTTS
jgi:site-specific recombinase XerD